MNYRRTIRRAIVILFWLLVAAAIGPMLAPDSWLADPIERAVARATGRTLTIDGDAEFWLLPWPGASISDVSLANAPWAGDQPLISIEQITVTPRLLPLLIGRLEIAAIEIDNPRINLSVDEHGRGNWIFE